MNMKIIAAGVLSLLVVGSARAEGARKSLRGFAVGVQVGYITQNSKMHQNFLTSLKLKQNKSISGDGLIGGVNFSYGDIISKYMFLGYEVKGDMSTLSGKQSEGNSNAAPRIKSDLKMKISVGGAVRVGLLDSAVLPYLKLGTLVSEWRSRSIILNSTTPGGGSKKKWLPGLELGLGVDYPLTYNVAMSAEFIHVEYTKLSYMTTSGVTTQYMKASFKPRTNGLMFRLRYRIC